MKKIALWLSVVLIGCCSITGTRYINGNRELVTELKNETIAFVKNNENDYSVYCSGIWISRNLILTAKHCIAASDPVLSFLHEQGVEVDMRGVDVYYVTYEDVANKKITARKGVVTTIDQYQDLAVVTIDDKTAPKHHPIAILTEDQPRDGDNVHIMGHTASMTWTYLKGYVSATRNPAYDWSGAATKALQIASSAYQGNSGGGAFNTRGELIGMMSWITNSAPGMGFFLHCDEIKLFLSRNRVNI